MTSVSDPAGEAATAPSTTPNVWSGRLYLWPARALYVGVAADTAVHAHHAIQVCLSLGAPFRLRGGARARWDAYELALVAPDRPHQLDGAGERVVLLYLDPESADGQALLVTAPHDGFALPTGQNLHTLRARFRAGAQSVGAAHAAVDALLTSLAPAPETCPAFDPRVARLLERLRQHPERRVSAAEAARCVALSSHRFQHVFRGATGVPFRRYLLWLRLVAAIDCVAAGGSLTAAAHAAGFSDSAHLSRTFRRMFGLTPSAVAKRSAFVQASESSPG